MHGELTVAIVGCGFIANEHIPAWRKINRVRIVATCDINEEACRATARRWNIPRYYTDFSTLLEKEHPSAVSICTPPQTHTPLAVQAMKAGCHVLLEKPMAMTTKDATEMLRTQRDTGVTLSVVHNWLFQQAVLEANDLIRNDRVGKVMGIHVEALYTKDDPMTSNKNHWTHKLPGGRFGESLAHPIYLIQNFLGIPLKVTGVSLNKTNGYPWMPYDELCATVRAPSGLGVIHIAYNSPREVVLVNIYGSRAILRVDLFTSTVTELRYVPSSKVAIGVDLLRQTAKLLTCAIKNTIRVITGKHRTGLEICIHGFAESILSGREPPVTPRSACETVKVIEQICLLTP